MRFFMIYLFGDYISFVHATKVQQKMHIRKSAVHFLFSGRASPIVYWTLPTV